jgi:hypothetical protein
MTYQEQIAREEYIAREDLLLGAEINDRINACRSRLRTADQALTASEIQYLYEVLGQCANELSNYTHQQQEDAARVLIANRVLQQMSCAEVVKPAEVLEMPAVTVLPEVFPAIRLAAD